MQKKTKEIRLNDFAQVRSDEQEPSKMIIEGYPIVFNTETFIYDGRKGFYEKIDANAFKNADMSDVCLKYNHNDNLLIIARTRNKSLQLTIDDKGVFMHAELIDTTTNKDVYEMVKNELLTEGSFAFTVNDEIEEEKADGVHRTITDIDKLFDVSICPNGAYSATEIYARSVDLVETKRAQVETSKNVAILKLRNKNKFKF